LITLQREHTGPMSTTASLIRRLAPLALFAALGVALAGCSHTTTGGDFSKPSAAATSAPMDLNAPADASAGSSVKTRAVTAAPAEPTPANVGTIDASAGDAPAVKPKKAAKVAPPAPPDEPAVAPAAFASDPKGDPGEPEKVPPPVVKTVRDDGFPNINSPPPEPSGKLLTPEERARVITELEALKNRQGVAPQKAPAKGTAKKCTDDQIAAGVKGCPPPSN
jgi:hypothetical protein